MNKLQTESEKVAAGEAGKHGFEDIHKLLFPNGVEPKTLSQLKAGVEHYIRKKYTRRS